jgi:hypothetical protein
MIYGSESALAVALFLVEVWPNAVNFKDAATSFIKQRYPIADLDSGAAQTLLAKAAGLHVDTISNDHASGPGGPCMTGSPAPPPPQAGSRTEMEPKGRQEMISVAPSPATANTKTASQVSRRNSAKNSAKSPRTVNGTASREQTMAAEIWGRFQTRDRSGSEVALKTLQAALGHILDKPGEEKYRCLKGSNARVKSEVMAHPEAVQILRLAGFSQVGEDLVFPEHASLQTIRDVLLGLQRPA